MRAPDPHAQTMELLPFYANGSLEGDEAESVRMHVEACSSCAAELDDFLEIGRAMEQRAVSAAPIEAKPARPGRQAVRLAALAALFLVPVAAGIVWSTRRDVQPVPEVVFDLGGGAQRNGDALPSLQAPVTGTVTFVLTVPAIAGAVYTADLIPANGGTGYHLDELGPPDPWGKLRLTVPAERLRVAGDHEVVIVRRTPSGEMQSYRYPFRVLPTP